MSPVTDSASTVGWVWEPDLTRHALSDPHDVAGGGSGSPDTREVGTGLGRLRSGRHSEPGQSDGREDAEATGLVPCRAACAGEAGRVRGHV